MISPCTPDRFTEHSCLLAQGTGAGCEKCHIKLSGHCEEFLTLLKVKELYLKKKDSLQNKDREDIIAEFVLQVHFSVNTFEGRRGAQFRTWAKTIFNNVWADFFDNMKPSKAVSTPDGIYFRRKPKREGDEYKPGIFFPITKKSEKAAIEARNLVKAILELIRVDVPGCYRFMLNYCNWEMEGLKQKEMAERYGLKQNTFNQKLLRCKTAIKNLLAEVEL
ncbi:type III-E CRISPR-associated RpoE-like sigma factor [Desulfobacterales bacterium HSG2]|nr:type III-E CRISPR-associated RpoE-like sigma factor [Desulfobacterales bacterium HSG2]